MATGVIPATGSIKLQSAHNYASNSNEQWVYASPGAGSITMTFSSQTQFENSYDYLIIYDASGEEFDRFSGTELAGKTIAVPGDQVKIVLKSDSSVTYWGFALTALHGTLKGDVNDNRKLNVVDAQIAYDVAKTYKLDDRPDYYALEIRTDVNGNEYLEANDAFAIQYAVLHGWS